MNNNSSKQILLSVIGVAILVVAVVGVSFAFFTYTKTGTQDNVITTGTLTFSFEDTSWINLTNHFPVATQADVTGENSECAFSVQGSAPAGTSLYYDIIAIDGTLAAEGNDYAGKTRFPNDEISVYLAPTGTGEGNTVTNYAETATGTLISNLEDVAVADGLNGKLLADGIMTGATGADGNTARTVSFTGKMWVDSDVVKVIGDNETATGAHTYKAADYGNMYYTMKIAVVARDTVRP